MAMLVISLLFLLVRISSGAPVPEASVQAIGELETPESMLRATSAGLSYAMGAELAWRSLSARSACLVRARYQQSAAISVLVVRGAFDNGENVLDALRLRYALGTAQELLEQGHFANSSGKTLIINSGATIAGNEVLRAVRTFVKRGGVLLTTNFAGSHLPQLFPHQGLRERTLATMGVLHSHVELQTPKPAASRASRFLTDTTSSRQRKRNRRQTNCQRSAAFLQIPAQDIHDRNMHALWAVDEAPLTISAGRHGSSAKATSIIGSHDLRPPFDSVMSCFNRRSGSVYHIMGRLFQLPETGSRRDMRADINPLPIAYARALLLNTMQNLDSASKRLIDKALSRTPPSMQQVISAGLSTGMVLRLLGREWQTAEELGAIAQESMQC